jgi:hypothetical protein
MLMTIALAVSLSLAPQTARAPQTTSPAANAMSEELWEAARAGAVTRLTRALDNGADVNAKTRYGVTALIFAADKGHLDAVRLLLDRGADMNVQDTFYGGRAIDMAMQNTHPAVVLLLLERGSKGAPGVLSGAVQRGNAPIVKAALASSDITAAHLTSAMEAAKRVGNAEIIGLIEAKAAALAATPAAGAVTIDRATLESYVGNYRLDSTGVTVTIALGAEGLNLTLPGQPTMTLIPKSRTSFGIPQTDVLTIAFAGGGGTIERMIVTQPNATQTFERVAAGAPPAVATPAPGASVPAASSAPPADPAAPRARTAARPWPAFRGRNAAGNGDGQGAVTEWNVESGRNIRWKTPIPGISNASPIVWGDRVFVVSAISSAGDKTFKTGIYGDVAPVNDLSEHTWKIYGLDKGTGRILWERTAFTGLPKTKRHMKASQANSTPVTDGTRVVALFGSIGMLAAWDVNGKPLWTVDLGVLDSGWFLDPAYQWGHASSPIIYRDTVILQADVQKSSFLAAYRLDNGEQVWRTARDEISTWGTPTVVRAGSTDVLVTNGPTIRGYDPATGKLLWTLGPNSEIAVATPVGGDGLVFVTGGYPPARPVYAIRPTASGDLSLPKDQTSSESIVWSNAEGTYIPTPIYYEGILYTCNNPGILTAYDAKTGERIYRARLGGGGSFSASPVAADGRLYFANEDGDVFVVRAGRSYQELAKNQVKEVIMGTPAIADGLIVIRTLGHVYGVGER